MLQPDLFKESEGITLYSSMASEKEAREFILNRLPITSENEMMGMLMMYQNTLKSSGSLPGAL